MTSWAILLRLLDNMLLILSMFSLAVDYSWFDWLRSDILRIARLVLINIASWLRTWRLKGLRRSNFLFPWWIASASTLWLSWRYIIFAFENGFWILLSLPSVWAFLTWLYSFVWFDYRYFVLNRLSFCPILLLLFVLLSFRPSWLFSDRDLPVFDRIADIVLPGSVTQGLSFHILDLLVYTDVI
jgi:hypothetical protein